MSNNKYIGILTVTLISLSFGVCSCRKSLSSQEEEGALCGKFSVIPSRYFDTKSLLTAPDIESRVSCVTLAAYSAGLLRARGFYKNASEMQEMKLSLISGQHYSIYAFVNMGDLTGDLPMSESSIGTVEYRIPSYTGSSSSLESMGLPMAGKLDDHVPGSSAPSSVEARRLVARVDARLRCTWGAAKIESVKVCNLNGRLRPFGVSKAESPTDILAAQEYSAGTLSDSGVFTFYVPENQQGESGGSLSGTADRRPDGSNGWISGHEGVLSYIEASISGAGEWRGNKIYRSYLGGGSLSDFNIMRNSLYQWDITYSVDGVTLNDWKHEGVMSHVTYSYRYFIAPESYSALFIGGEKQLVLSYETTELIDGVVSSVSSVPITQGVRFVSSNPGCLTISSSGLAKGLSKGSVLVTAYVSTGGTELKAASRSIMVDEWYDDWDDELIDL